MPNLPGSCGLKEDTGLMLQEGTIIPVWLSSCFFEKSPRSLLWGSLLPLASLPQSNKLFLDSVYAPKINLDPPYVPCQPRQPHQSRSACPSSLTPFTHPVQWWGTAAASLSSGLVVRLSKIYWATVNGDTPLQNSWSPNKIFSSPHKKKNF